MFYSIDWTVSARSLLINLPNHLERRVSKMLKWIEEFWYLLNILVSNWKISRK